MSDHSVSTYRARGIVFASKGLAASRRGTAIAPAPEEDLVFRGGRMLPDMSYKIFYVGDVWATSPLSDFRRQLDFALAAAMSDPALNDIVGQYFAGSPILTTALPSAVLNVPVQDVVNKDDVQGFVKQLFTSGDLSDIDFPNCAVNFVLPPGAVLSSDGGGEAHAQRALPKPGTPEAEDEAIIIAFRRHTLLPLDDCLYAAAAHDPASDALVAALMPAASRYQPIAGCRRGQAPKEKVQDLPDRLLPHRPRRGPDRRRQALPLCRHRPHKQIRLRAVRKKTGRTSASAFLEALIEAVPYKIHTVLTDNGIQFTFPPRYADGPTARYVTHMFDMRCQENGIEHRLTKIKHPWTNGQVERMNRTIKEATVKRYHYDRHHQLETHLADFINAYNYGRRLKTLNGLTPYEYICNVWTSQARTIHTQSAPANAGTKHLASCFDLTAAQLQCAEQAGCGRNVP